MRRNKTRLIMSLLFAAVGSYGCGGSSSTKDSTATTATSLYPRTSVSLYKYSGSVQCTAGGLSLAEMRRELTDAGIRVLGADCGDDGKLYPAVCGGGDGSIGIFEVPATQAEKASALGYAPLNALPDASKVECK